MITYKYVDNEEMVEFTCENREDAMEKIVAHFQDTRKNHVIPYELSDDGVLQMNMNDMEQLKELRTFFKENPTYGQEVSQQEAMSLQKEFA